MQFSRALSISFLLFAVLSTSIGCVGPRSSIADMPRDIRWLTVALQHKGVMIRERGSAFIEVPSTADARLILDSKEVVDAFEFPSAEIAKSQAFRLSGLYPRNDVFVVDSLVVLRFTTSGTGLTATLVEVLGTPI